MMGLSGVVNEYGDGKSPQAIIADVRLRKQSRDLFCGSEPDVKERFSEQAREADVHSNEIMCIKVP